MGGAFPRVCSLLAAAPGVNKLEPLRGSYTAYPAKREDESTSQSTSPLHHFTFSHRLHRFLRLPCERLSLHHLYYLIQSTHHVSHQTHTQPAEFSSVREPLRGSYTAYTAMREDEATSQSTSPLHIQPQITQISQITLRAIITLSPLLPHSVDPPCQPPNSPQPAEFSSAENPEWVHTPLTQL